MITKSTNSSEEKDLFLLHAIEMIVLSFKAVGISFVLVITYVSLQMKTNLLYFLFPSHNYLLSYIYFFIFIVLFSVLLGLAFHLGASKKEILERHEKKELLTWEDCFMWFSWIPGFSRFS